MGTDDTTQILTTTVDRLCAPESLKGLYQSHSNATPLPSQQALKETIQLVRAILFPGYFGTPSALSPTSYLLPPTFYLLPSTLKYRIGVDVERLHRLLVSQTSAEVADKMIEKLPSLRAILATDVEAAYNGDPAAESYGEIISCYPVIKAIINYRFAHELLLLGVPLIPRVITELAHSETGIDIHPGARIGHHFTIDHGTGVVIGATCIIGNNVKLYQGVTLGAKSFPLDENGNPIKGIDRHPILEDNVIVYSNATILGRVTIGADSVIGANVWITRDVEKNSKIVISNHGD